MTKTIGSILLEAHALVNQGRQADYGAPAESFARIARLWSVYLGREITGKDVAMCMALLKISREAHCHKRDNLLDAAGYIGLAADAANGEAADGQVTDEEIVILASGIGEQDPANLTDAQADLISTACYGYLQRVHAWRRNKPNKKEVE